MKASTSSLHRSWTKATLRQLLRGLSLAGLTFLAPSLSVAGGETEIGGDARYYQFIVTENPVEDRRHAELGIFRVKFVGFLGDELRVEAHGVFQFSSPPAFNTTAIASGTTRRYFDLEWSIVDNDNWLAVLELDRLNMRWERPSFRLLVGRQAITWGVNTFWPVLDLFAPFAPERIDRDYKPGVDAVRWTVPLGDFSEVEVIAAGQGERFPSDFSLASLARFNVGTSDLGFMGGRFHTDTVVGAFVATDLSGTGVRGEVAFTHSGNEGDAEINREQFVRATAGLDRQLTTSLNLTAEVSWNGFGTDDPRDYLLIASSDRVSRGEVGSLGRRYTGLSLTWRVHPLLTVSVAALTNWGDRSTLLQTFGDWPVSNSVTVQFGGAYGLGPGLDSGGNLQSEYGAVSPSFWGAFKVYF